jgi:predicted nucleotidyltransferase
MSQVVEERKFVQTPDDDGEVTLPKILFTVEEIVRRANPVRVMAFGSRARGDHRKNSDLDLAVIVEKYDRKVDDRPVWRADIDVWMDIDLLVYDIEREELMADSQVSLQSEVKKEGVLLFDRQTGIIDQAAAARLV